MPTPGRRPVLRGVAASAAVLLGGCSGRSGEPSPRRPTESNPVRELDPVQAEGDPYRVSSTTRRGRDPDAMLRNAVGDRSDCLLGELPVERYDSGLRVTTTTVVETLDDTNVAFPSRAYRHLKQIAPRSVSITDAGTDGTAADEIPVFVRAVLRRGDDGEITPEMRGDCP